MKIDKNMHSPDPAKELQKSVAHFKDHLNAYRHAATKEEKEAKAHQMEREISLMDLAAQSMKKETRVQERKVAKDFSVFQKNPSENNLNVLEQDLTTLKESLEH